MDVSMDVSQVTKLAVDLGKVPGRMVPEAVRVVFKAAMNVKKGMAEDVSGHERFKHLPRAVDFTIQGLEAEIGIAKDARQGQLGNIAAFGTSRSGPVFDHTAALHREAPNFEKFLAEAGTKVLGL